MKRRLDPAKIKLVGGRQALVLNAEVDELQERLGTLPNGYREFVTQLGEGLIGLTFYVLPPWDILGNLDQHRARMADWRWDSGDVPFGRGEAVESVWIIAGHFAGDVVFHPSVPTRLVYLPPAGGQIAAFEGDIFEFLEWALTGGIFRSPRRHQFEPASSRGWHEPEPVSHPRPTWVPDLATPPALDHAPRDVLAAYFSELCAVERWATEAHGGYEAFGRDQPPEADDALMDEICTMSTLVGARYCTPLLHAAMGSGTVTYGGDAPEHDPVAIRLLSETMMSPTRVAIETAEGTLVVFHHRYILDRSDAGWRIAAHRELGVIPEGQDPV